MKNDCERPSPPADPIAAATHPDPYPYYEELARLDGLSWHGGLSLWLAASAATVQAVLADPACRVRPAGEPTPPPLAGTPAGEVFRRLVRMNDGEIHARLRPALERSLAAAPLPVARKLAGAQMQALLDAAPRPLSGGALDALLSALPARVVGALLGVAEAGLPELAVLAADFARCLATGGAPEHAARGQVAAAQLTDLFRSSADLGLLDRLRGELDEEALAANAVGFLSQAFDATAGLIGNGLIALARRPEARAALLREPDRMAPFLAEALRHDSPVQNTRRYLHGDAVVAGTRLPAGAAILVLLAAANRDPAANPAPHDFLVDRPERRLFTFGLAAHACPGEALARTIAGEALSRLAACGLDWERVAATRRYRPSANARVPDFAADAGKGTA